MGRGLERSRIASRQPALSARRRRNPRDHPVRHIQRDYGYVRSELTRIAALAAIIVLGLVVVAIIR